MAERAERVTNVFPRVLNAVLRRLAGHEHIQEVATVDPVVSTPEASLKSGLEPPPLPTLSPREQRIRDYLRNPPGTGNPVATKRKHFHPLTPSPNIPLLVPDEMDLSQGPYLLQTPRFKRQLQKLPLEGQREVLGAMVAIMQGKGELHPLYDTGGSIKLYTAREHAGNKDDRRIICIRVNGVIEGRREAFYMIGILSGHDYGRNIIDGLLKTAKLILSGRQDEKIMALNPQVKFLT